MSEKWRSAKAKKQLRDRFGRWISLGANVRYRGDGAEQSGTVTGVEDGKAYVDQKNADGSISKKLVDSSAIRVIASKATLAAPTEKFFDKDNNFTKALKNPTYTTLLELKKKAGIERADGYVLNAELRDDDPSNPIIYQLYAPGGRSLGSYGKAAEGDFDDMVLEDQGGQGEEAPAEGGEAPAAVAASVLSSGEEKPFRVPSSVRSEIQSTLSSLSDKLPEADLAVATRLANDDTVSLSDVQWVHAYFCEIDASERLRGGFKGRKWASKIVDPTAAEIPVPDDTGLDTHPKYFFDDDVYAYFAVGSDPGSTIVNRLLSVDYETGAVYAWTADGFVVIPDLDMTEVDEPQIIPIDEMTADEFAHWLDSGTAEEFDILDTNPEERNLFTLAESEIDFDELDRSFAIIAAGESYTPVERAQNAKAQRRGSGGKFGSEPDAPAAPEEGGEPKVQKARLPMALPLVANPAARISEWLSQAAEAPVVAAAEPVEGEAPAEGYSPEEQALEDQATGPTNEALYFAIVDEIDKTAVLDIVAIVKQNGQPSAFIRAQGVWKADPDTLTLLQGNTPPAVVELPDPETVKTVIQQIDAHDSGADTTPEPQGVAPGETPIAASGFAMEDGSYTIINVDDLKAVVASVGTPDIFTKAHIRKRARALNRMDVVPAEWREFSLPEIGELEASNNVYGPYGEILVASGLPGVADTPSDFKNVAKLQAYWTTGKGALKIRWGTKGDLTRAHRHLSKYVGPQRAWGLAQKYHKSLFGVYNYTHDVATGQYSPRRKR
jgi:hypothetical protein